MVKFYDDVKKVRNSNLCIIVKGEKFDDIPHLEKHFEDKLKKLLKEKKSFFHTFFIGKKDIENIYVCYHAENDKKNIYEFLAENISKLPHNLTLMGQTEPLLEKLLETTLLSRYTFQKYKSEKKFDEIYVISSQQNQKRLQKRLKTIENIIFARDLGDTPTHDLTPEVFAKIVKNIEWKNTKIKVFGPNDISKMKMGLLKAVGWGSQHKPHFVILERIVDKKAPTIGFVGKGIVFDTGGLNIKLPSPIGGMELMKFDMAGAATVLGVMKELDRKKIPVNIIAGIPLAENSIGGESMRPSDILTAYNGKTVLISNTDAEGRLVLADALSYLSKNYKIDRFVSIATLTGLCLVAFDCKYAAMMGNDRQMLDSLRQYTHTHFEKYWELPFDDFYLEKVKSTIADYDNLPKSFGGIMLGGAFIYHFRENNEKFTHIDIASVADCQKPYGLYAKGCTGFGVESLSEIFQNFKG